MSLLTYFVIYSQFWSSVILTFFPGIIIYRNYALLMAIISTLVIIVEIVRNKAKVSLNTIRVVLLMGIIISLYYLTRYFYSGKKVEAYQSLFLSLVGQTFPAVILASICAKKDEVCISIKKQAPVIAVCFSLISLLSALLPTSVTSGGYMITDNGLNYQSASYMAAIASGFFCFTYLTKDAEFHYYFVKNKIGTIICIAGLLVNLFVIFICGGRGALVVFIVFILLLVFYVFKKQDRVNRRLARGLIIALAIIVIFLVSSRFASISNVSTSGYNRILSFLRDREDLGRTSMAQSALQVIKTNPLFGHGMGSVFFELGYYSHNIVLDVLIETGTIGLLITSLVLVSFIKKIHVLIREDGTNIFYLILFLGQFIESLFSGYYLAFFAMFWAVCFVLCRSEYKKSLE